jgi:hypothetical protein
VKDFVPCLGMLSGHAGSWLKRSEIKAAKQFIDWEPPVRIEVNFIGTLQILCGLLEPVDRQLTLAFL